MAALAFPARLRWGHVSLFCRAGGAAAQRRGEGWRTAGGAPYSPPNRELTLLLSPSHPPCDEGVAPSFSRRAHC